MGNDRKRHSVGIARLQWRREIFRLRYVAVI